MSIGPPNGADADRRGRCRAGRLDRGLPPEPRRATTSCVLERTDVAGGRTHSTTTATGIGSTPAPGGWRASIPTRWRCSTSSVCGSLLTPLALRGGGDLLLDGAPRARPELDRPDPADVADRRAGQDSLALATWPALRSPARDLQVDPPYDATPAIDELALDRRRGPRPRRAAQLRGSVLRPLGDDVGSTGAVVAALPQRRLLLPGRRWDGPAVARARSTAAAADRCRRAHRGAGRVGVDVTVGATAHSYDAVVVAIPAPEAARIVAAIDRPAALP